MYTELKVITVYNDERKFENDVNCWCCNNEYKIISCKIAIVDSVNIMYTVFLGK